MIWSEPDTGFLFFQIPEDRASLRRAEVEGGQGPHEVPAAAGQGGAGEAGGHREGDRGKVGQPDQAPGREGGGHQGTG